MDHRSRFGDLRTGNWAVRWLCSSIRTGEEDGKQAGKSQNESEAFAHSLRFRMLHVPLNSSGTDISISESKTVEKTDH